MTARVDLAEFLGAYVAEAEEQLSIASARATAIEAAQRKKEASPRAVRDLFRALHTIKGLSAMVGVEPVVTLSHKMEAVLRAADKAGGQLAPNALEPLLEGLRAIDLRVRALADKKPVPAPPVALVTALDSLKGGDAGDGAAEGPSLDLAPAIAQKLAPFERQQLVAAPDDGRRAVSVEFVPSTERTAMGQTINSVRERVATIAEIVKVVPVALDADRQAPSGLAFVLLLVTAASDAAIAEAASVDSAAVRAIQRSTPPPPVRAAAADDEHDPDLPEEQPDRRNVLRVDVSRVDDAMERLSSLIVSRSRLARGVARLGETAEARELRAIAADMGRQLRDLRSAILAVRMVPVAELLERLPLVVRGLQRATGRHVRLEVDAGDAELDKAVAERIFPALLHLVRNAIDHGVEPPEERRAAGKPEEGLVRIVATARSNTQLELVVSDDGHGIRRDQVAARAGAELPQTDAALLDLMCRPGLSTRDEVTTTSGRGMGMDIVRRVVEGQLGGELLLSTRPGQGATFTLRVPLTIAIVDAFIAAAGAQRYVVPVSVVEEIVDLESKDVVSVAVAGGQAGARVGMFERRGEVVPLVDLAALLGVRREGAPATRALVVRRNGEPVAFVLDRVLGQQEAVVRPLVDPLVHVPGVSGATDLGDGSPTLVLDLVALAALRPAKVLAAPAPSPLLPAGQRRAS